VSRLIFVLSTILKHLIISNFIRILSLKILFTRMFQALPLFYPSASNCLCDSSVIFVSFLCVCVRACVFFMLYFQLILNFFFHSFFAADINMFCNAIQWLYSVATRYWFHTRWYAANLTLKIRKTWAIAFFRITNTPHLNTNFGALVRIIGTDYIKDMEVLMDCELYDYVFSQSFKLLGVICNIVFTFLNTDFFPPQVHHPHCVLCK
jgi:hypothetical protein